MALAEDVERFLPSAAHAEQAGITLPAERPFAEHKLAALLVFGQILRRDGWAEQKTLAERDVERLRKELPAEGKPGAAYHLLGQILGRSPGGVRCRIHHYSDDLVDLREIFVPRIITSSNEMRHLDRALESLLMRQAPPEELRCNDLMPHAAGSAYRAGPIQTPPDFFGFEFQDALDRASAAVNGALSRGAALAVHVHAYAWPLLWLCYGEQAPAPDVALVVDPHGQLRAIGGVLPPA